MHRTEHRINNYFNNTEYILRPVVGDLLSEDRIAQLVKVCNEIPIYNILFKEKLQNRPYSKFDAVKFFEWGTRGWEEQEYFVFLVESHAGEVAAAIDVKSSDKTFSEVGYWSSIAHRGIMTNALTALVNAAREVGYKKLFAKVRKENLGSIKVLINNQFVKDEKWQEDPIRFRFTREIAR